MKNLNETLTFVLQEYDRTESSRKDLCKVVDSETGKFGYIPFEELCPESQGKYNELTEKLYYLRNQVNRIRSVVDETFEHIVHNF